MLDSRVESQYGSDMTQKIRVRVESTRKFRELSRVRIVESPILLKNIVKFVHMFIA